MESVFSDASTWITQYGYAGLFCLLMLGIVGLPVPDETLLMFCGYLIWKGRLHPASTFFAGFAGSLSGISISYLLGRTYGSTVVHRYGRFIGLTERRLDRVHRWFSKLGAWLLAVGYFIPGVRHFSALVAGMTGLPWPIFALFAYTGAAVWVATFLSIGYAVGDRWQQTAALLNRYAVFATLASITLGLVFWLVRRSLGNRNGKIEI